MKQLNLFFKTGITSEVLFRTDCETNRSDFIKIKIEKKYSHSRIYRDNRVLEDWNIGTKHFLKQSAIIIFLGSTRRNLNFTI